MSTADDLRAMSVEANKPYTMNEILARCRECAGSGKTYAAFDVGRWTSEIAGALRRDHGVKIYPRDAGETMIVDWSH